MSDAQFRLLSREELTGLYHTHMVHDFPANELRPLNRMLDMVAKGAYETYGLFQDGKLLAYAFYWTTGEDTYVILDYFAVLPEGRNQGTGSAFLRQMLEHFCRDGHGIFGEVEVPNTGDEEVDALRRRRLGFYTRAGLRQMGYTSKIYGVPYLVLSYGPEISDEELMLTHRKLYHSVFSDEIYEKQVFIPEMIL